MGARRPDRNGSNVLENGARDKPKKNKGNGVQPRIHLGEVGGAGLEEMGDGRRVNLQGAEEDKGELRHVKRDGGGVLS